MITQKQVDEKILLIPQDATADDRRCAAGVLIGCRDDKSISEISKYYWMTIEMASKWWTFFDLEKNNKSVVKNKKSKTSSIKTFVDSHIGEEFLSTEISSACKISAPSFYNFLNANRGYFQKVSRGKYKILDPASERKTSKNE